MSNEYTFWEGEKKKKKEMRFPLAAGVLLMMMETFKSFSSDTGAFCQLWAVIEMLLKEKPFSVGDILAPPFSFFKLLPKLSPQRCLWKKGGRNRWSPFDVWGEAIQQRSCERGKEAQRHERAHFHPPVTHTSRRDLCAPCIDQHVRYRNPFPMDFLTLIVSNSGCFSCLTNQFLVYSFYPYHKEYELQKTETGNYFLAFKKVGIGWSWLIIGCRPDNKT